MATHVIVVFALIIIQVSVSVTGWLQSAHFCGLQISDPH